MALRATLPVRRTTPYVVLHRKGRIPPASILLEEYLLRLAARLNSLEDRYPLRVGASVFPKIGTLKYKSKARLSKKPELKISRIQRAFRQLLQSEGEEPLPGPVYFPILGKKADGKENH